MIIGMVPMALGLGDGGEQNAPLGRAVIGRLIFATAYCFGLCALLSLTIAFVDWPLTSMTKRAAELMILLVGVAVQIYAVVHRFRYLCWRREYELSVDRVIRTIHPTV